MLCIGITADNFYDPLGFQYSGGLIGDIGFDYLCSAWFARADVDDPESSWSFPKFLFVQGQWIICSLNIKAG